MVADYGPSVSDIFGVCSVISCVFKEVILYFDLKEFLALREGSGYWFVQRQGWGMLKEQRPLPETPEFIEIVS